MSAVVISCALVLILAAALLARPHTGSAGSAAINVNSTADDIDANDGECTLREAITSANSGLASGPVEGECEGGEYIQFELPGCPPACTITPAIRLPDIEHDNTTIDGTTQAGYTGTPIVTVDFSTSAQLFTYLNVEANSVQILGMVFTGGMSSGIVVCPPGGSDTGQKSTIEGNQITNYAGTGIAVCGARQVRLSDNLISGNGDVGIEANNAVDLMITGNTVTDNASHGMLLSGERITVTGNTVSANGESGIVTAGGAIPDLIVSGNVVEDNAETGISFNANPGQLTGNVASGNGHVGMRVAGNAAAVHQNTVTGNGTGIPAKITPQGDPPPGRGIDLAADNSTLLGNVITGNLLHGVVINGDNNAIYFDGLSTNVITNNGGAGIRVESGEQNQVWGNSIDSNGGLGIDLVGAADGANGVTVNDFGDADTGANTLLNFPVITEAAPGSLTVRGIYAGAFGQYALAFYASDECDESGHGEGQTFLGSHEIVTGPDGTTAFEASLTADVEAGRYITATATSFMIGDTSEFSECFQVPGAETPTPTPSSTPTPSPTPTPTATIGPSPTTTATPAATPTPLTQGNVDCDGEVDAEDALKTILYAAGLQYGQEAGCPPIGGPALVALPAGAGAVFGDVDCDGEVDVVDALQILRFVALLTVSQPAGCADIGEPLQ